VDYQIISPTSHYTIRDRWIFRDCWVRTTDGVLELWMIPDGPIGGTK
jgi:hypothetical protein